MQIGAVKTEDGKVSYETAEGTVVHININQRSAFDCLLDALRFLRDLKRSEPKAAPARRTASVGHLGFGVAYISLGLVSVMLAVVIAVVHPHLGIFYSRVHFWVGFPFLVSGILNLVAYKFPNACWMALAFISLLVNFGVSIAGTVITANDIQYPPWTAPSEQICSDLLGDRYYDRATRFPRYDNGRDYDLQRCITQLQRYEALKQGLIIISLLMMIWGLCLAIPSVGLRVKSFCCSCKLERTEEIDDPLLKPSPDDDIIV
ncbi:uncharacterized protein [Eleutherodactylus coqui]|uniref:uncharacterized protein n=1 Tax=Eleutherodactylus coqui TaxID=57060 RepID=UPI0034623CA7